MTDLRTHVITICINFDILKVSLIEIIPGLAPVY